VKAAIEADEDDLEFDNFLTAYEFSISVEWAAFSEIKGSPGGHAGIQDDTRAKELWGRGANRIYTTA